jgi:hypothetical protein
MTACGSSSPGKQPPLTSALLQRSDLGDRLTVVVSGSRWDGRTMTALATTPGPRGNCHTGRFVRFSGAGNDSDAKKLYAAAQKPFGRIMATDIASQYPKPLNVPVGDAGVVFLEQPFTPPPLPHLRQLVFRRGSFVAEVDTEQVGTDDPQVTVALAQRLDYRIRQLEAGCPKAVAGCGGSLPPVPGPSDFAPPPMPAPPPPGTPAPA